MTISLSAAITVSDLTPTAFPHYFNPGANNPGGRVTPSIAVAGDGSLAVAWSEASAAYNPTSLPAWTTDFQSQWIYTPGEIVARVLDADGQARGTTFQVNTAFYGQQDRPQVVAQADGDFFVAFTSSGVTGGAFFPPLPVQGPPGEPTRGQLPPYANVVLYEIAAGTGQADATPVANYGLVAGAEVFERAIDLDLDAGGNAVATLVNGSPTRLTTVTAPWVLSYAAAPVSVRTPDAFIGSVGREVNADILITVQTAVLTGGQIVTAGGYGTLGGVFPFVTGSVAANPLYFHIDGGLAFRLDNAVPAHDPRYGVTYSMEGIAALADGGFVLLFQQGAGLFAQAYNADGSERAEPVQIISGRAEVDDVIGLADGGFFVAYHGYLDTGWQNTVASFAVFASDGTAIGSPFTPGVYIPAYGGFSNIRTDLDLALTPEGDVALAWSDGFGVHVASFSGITANRPPTGLGFTPAVPGLAEDAANDALAGVLAGIDPDSTLFTYEIVDNAGNPAAATSPFKIVGASLRVSGVAPLDHETRPLEEIFVKVTDSAGNAIIRGVQVAIGDANDAPTGAAFTSGLPYVAIDENPTQGTYLGRVVGLDPDQGDKTTVAFWRDPGTGFLYDGNGALTMNSAGDLFVAKRLAFDFEAGGVGFFVEVTDQAGAKTTQYISVTLNDVENEHVTGSHQNDTILGGRGNDSLTGLGGDDWLQGDQGFPYFGIGSDDTLVGGSGADTLIGGFGVDRLLGQGGDDVFVMHSDDMAPGEFISGGQGFDTLRLETGHHSLFGVTLSSVEEIRLVGRESATLELGHAGQAARLVEASGIDDLVRFDGNLTPATRQQLAQVGVERISYLTGGLDVMETYHPGPPLGVMASRTLNDINNIVPYTTSTRFFDPTGVLTSEAWLSDDGRLFETDYSPLGAVTKRVVTDTLNAFSYQSITTTFEPNGDQRLQVRVLDNGNQWLTGGPGANVLMGSAGNDRMTGGGGADIFAFYPGGGADRVMDFLDGTDKLDLTAFGIHTVAGILAAGGTISQVGSALRIDFALQGSLTVAGLTSASFGNADLL